VGIIEKQATRNAIYSYIGAALGFITLFWMPRLLNSEENGLIRVLISFATLFSQFSNLGFNAVTIRLFPHFRDKEKGHNGFLFYAITIPATGFIISCIFFFLFKENIIANNIEKSKLLVDYLYYLIPLTFFTLFFNVFDTYLRAGFNSVLGSSSKEVVQRILIILILCLYFFKLINFHAFVFLYTVAISVSTLILVFYLIANGEWHVKRNKDFMTPKIQREIIKLSSLTALSELSAGIIISIDSIMLNYLLGLSKTGIYGIAANFGNLMTIPARAISRITSSIVVEHFKKDDLKAIEALYKKSCNTQLAIGAILLIGVLVNIDNVMGLLPTEYQSGKSVIIILSLGYFVEMATGLNHIIVVFSKYYKYDSYFIATLVFIAILFNYIFIPIFGITGAALATASTLTFGNCMRSLFVYYKFKMQPYDMNTIKTIIISLLCLFLGNIIPKINNIIVDTFIRSGITILAFIILILIWEATPELNNKIRKNLKRFF
jgi:O-antigen/teichoic acid export membrane protein